MLCHIIICLDLILVLPFRIPLEVYVSCVFQLMDALNLVLNLRIVISLVMLSIERGVLVLMVVEFGYLVVRFLCKPILLYD